MAEAYEPVGGKFFNIRLSTAPLTAADGHRIKKEPLGLSARRELQKMELWMGLGKS